MDADIMKKVDSDLKMYCGGMLGLYFLSKGEDKVIIVKQSTQRNNLIIGSNVQK